MDIKELKKNWYERNKPRIREEENNIYYKRFRNQRLLVRRLKGQLDAGKYHLKKYYNEMKANRDKIRSNTNKKEGETLISNGII